MAAIESPPGPVRRIACAVVSATGRWLADLEDFALAQRCPGCGRCCGPDEVPCRACADAIPRLEMALCARCLARGGDPAGCSHHPGYTTWAAWVYEERAALAIHALKYHGRPRLARRLGAVIAAALPAAYRPDLVLAVPLHSARQRERGYNQAAWLADAVAERLRCPRGPEVLERSRATRPQARLGPAARRANLGGAFRVRQPWALERRNVLVVDDVMTTGSTLEACLAALEACGARGSGATVAWAS
jgi:ComF family protein